MYYYLSGALKRRLILELQDSFSKHPLYEKVVPFIQNKYAFEERPQFGIVVKGASGNKVALSSDNFMGTVVSHVMLAYYGEPSYPIEWVREDSEAINANGGVFPILPGIYYIEILSAPTNISEPGQLMVDPLLTITQEPAGVFTSGVEQAAKLRHPPVKGTLRLYENAFFMLTEGQDYKVDYTDGRITFIAPFNPKATVLADYRFAAPSIGPIDFYWNRSDTATLPGVVMAFGKRARAKDKVAIVVTGDRVDTARAYGGKFEYTFDLDIIATDPMQMEEMADLALMYIWAYKKPELETEGIEVVEISPGGEAEEQRDEQADEYYYTASMSVQLRADWEIHVPLPLIVSKVTARKDDGSNGGAGSSGIVAVSSRLFMATIPVFANRNNDFERIG